MDILRKNLSSLQYANFCYKKKNYNDAIIFFLKSPISGFDNISLEKLADCYLRIKDIDNAILIYKRLEDRNYQTDNFYNSYGVALKEKKKYISAIEKFELGLQINAKNYFILFNLANLYLENTDLTKAKSYYIKCIRIKKEFYQASVNIATIALKEGKVNNALVILCKILKKRKTDVILLENIAKIYLQKQNYFKAEFYFKKLIKIERKNLKKIIPVLQGYTYQGKNKSYKRLAKFFTRNLTNKNQIFEFIKDSKKKIKVGFLSPDIRSHPIGYFLKDAMPYLSQSFDINFFETSGHYDEISVFIKKFSRWFDCSNLESPNIAEIIFKEKISILFDLSGFTHGNRMEVLKLKPSPVQISWAGWLSSTHLKQIDYIVGDHFSVRKTDEKNFTEKILRLKDIWCVYSKSVLNNLRIRNNNSDNVIYGCCQRPEKINQLVLKTFSRILRRKVDSFLFFNNGIFQNYDKIRILSFLKKNGVDESRIKFASSRNRTEYLRSFNQVDINLDTFPYNGGTTNFESAFMGVPLITMENDSVMFRCGESINQNLKMANWISINTQDYVEKAVEFGNLKKLKNEKKELLLKCHKSPLFDVKRFCQNFEDQLVKL